MFFFFLQKFISRQFFILPNLCYANCILILPILVLKWNKTSYIEYFFAKIFVSFLKLLNLNRYGLFLSHVKQIFKIMIASD